MAKNSTRVVTRDYHEGKGYTDETSLANAFLTRPDRINPVITHLQGKESDKFPLSFLTEGQGKRGIRTIAINDVEYEWDTFKRLRLSDTVVSTTYAGSDKPGLGGQEFHVIFESDWLKTDHTVASPSGIQCRIQGRPVRVGNHFKYTLVLQVQTPGRFVQLSELAAGKKWSMVGGAAVSQSRSRGNESNTQMPGKMKNQVSTIRKSYEVPGNLANKVVEVIFDIDGKKTNLWIRFEEWQHMLQWRQACEEHYWYSEYNRLENGSVPLKDQHNGKPIYIGAGVFNQIPNRDTYSSLTTKKLKNTVADIFYGATDTGNMNVVLYTGEGGMEEFDNAIKGDSLFTKLASGNISDKFVKGSGRNMTFTGFFTQYEHIDGHTVTVKKLPLLDHGGRAENSPKHPETGKPLESYRMAFVDMSNYGGENNVKMVHEKGRSYIRRIERGMNDVGFDFKGNNTDLVSTDEDTSMIHFLASKGICIRRNTHCFLLEPDYNELA